MMNVHIVDTALPPGVLAAVQTDARALADCKNFWVTKESILQGPSSCSTPAELAVCLLHQHVAHLLPDTWTGAEYWVQVYKPGVGLGFHFDKDEHLLTATGQMQHPIWSSILYLTGSTGAPDSSSSSNSSRSKSSSSTPEDSTRASSGAEPSGQQLQQQANGGVQPQQQQQQGTLGAANDWDGVRQAPTVILQQQYDQQLCCPVPPAPSSSMLVWPLRNSYCLFDGRLGHGVLDSCSSSIRATLLVNWWTACPQSVKQLQDAAIEQHHLTRLGSSSSIQHLLSSGGGGVGGSSGCTGCNSSTGDISSQMAAVTLNGDHHQQQQQQDGQQQQQRRWPHVVVTAEPDADDEDGGMQLVDEVLAKHQVSVTGPSAVSAVQFEHPGLVLFPIEAPAGQAGSSGGSGSGGSDGRLQTLGAFVSADLMGDDGSNDDDGSSSSGDESSQECA